MKFCFLSTKSLLLNLKYVTFFFMFMLKSKYVKNKRGLLMNEISALQKARQAYNPKLPTVLSKGINNLVIKEGVATEAVRDKESIKEIFSKLYGAPIVTFEEGATKPSAQRNVGVILSGGQAPGGHNVIAGILLLVYDSDNC